MTERSFRGKPKKTAKVNPNAVMEQFELMQQQMRSTQEKLSEELYTVTAGGGALTVVITGHQRVKSLTIDPEMLNPEDVETLQELLISTINQAIEQSQSKAAERMEGITGNLGVSDLLGGLGLNI